MANYKATILQGGMAVTEVLGADPERVERELRHCIVRYAQDGPLSIKRNRALTRWLEGQTKEGGR